MSPVGLEMEIVEAVPGLLGPMDTLLDAGGKLGEALIHHETAKPAHDRVGHGVHVALMHRATS